MSQIEAFLLTAGGIIILTIAIYAASRFRPLLGLAVTAICFGAIAAFGASFGLPLFILLIVFGTAIGLIGFIGRDLSPSVKSSRGEEE